MEISERERNNKIQNKLGYKTVRVVCAEIRNIMYWEKEEKISNEDCIISPFKAPNLFAITTNLFFE